ncbi:hypothetical protein WP7S18C02_09860 [Klebsiella sp. WP7-S18-CRE-02]|nr:hypothetical protein WP3W18E02_09500 [Klebsiella sp. WP3-W18-ESBL-02]BBR19460.1 hypothetical protein WP3S18E05_09400 [Klebsiella sp. WP3-S18-ESBL-05]BBR57604.1 hypothetical protein WP4W18E05_09720 [Klebsiella sp. WP4-W18-ESBL-05]BBS90371.1 hypothetical protein WP7S18C02_09860 [Klebsiella sp. WP7-S18-CRE-02]BBS95394.1 hypothetical protein WP7S18C03_09870 [Klebsiella sp. WP7-S18-CRE-03]BBT00426.1 hypothetical protein WP7S18E04_09880 [Klebsiella sp. WP7-S18-ESBL-04]BBT69680.1 hypothetical pro
MRKEHDGNNSRFLSEKAAEVQGIMLSGNPDA